MIFVVNKFCGASCINVSTGSVLDNKFKPNESMSIESCVLEYRLWLREEYKKKSGAVYFELMRLVGLHKKGDITLVCGCGQKVCHVDVIKEAIINIASKAK